MNAKLLPRSARRRPWAVRPWTLAVLGVLLIAGALVQACSDNNGTTGPTFGCNEAKAGTNSKALSACTGTPAPSTGFANTSAEIKVVVGINPNAITPGRRAGVTAFVTNLNGQPLAGKKVQFSTDVGNLDQTVVNTNAAGQASTTLSITPTDVVNAAGKTSATVTAFVEGATPGTGVVNFGPVSTLAISPPSVSQTVTGGPPCAINLQFSATGGVPPYTFTAGIAANMSPTGSYTANIPAVGPFADTVTVTDSAGATASATISVNCGA